MGGNHFTVPCTISYNGFRVDSYALTDTRANGFAFIDTACAIDVAKFLDIKMTQLEKPITVKGFDGKHGKAVTHILILHLSIDGHQQTNIPFCILDLGNHDIILGLNWMEYFDIWLNPHSQRLVWPDDESWLVPPSFHREIRTHCQAIMQRKGQSTYQQDVETQDQAFVQEDVCRKAGTQSTPKKILNWHETAELTSKSVAESDSGYESAGSMEIKAMEVALLAKTSESLSPSPGKKNQNSNCKPWVLKDIRRHTECLTSKTIYRRWSVSYKENPL